MDMEIKMDVETNEDLEALRELEIQYEKENGKDSRNSNLGRTSIISNHSNKEADDERMTPKRCRDVLNDRTGNIENKELRNSTPGSRSSLKSSNKGNTFAENKKLSFDDDIEVKDLSANITLQDSDFPESEPADWYPSDENEDELFIVLDSDNKMTDEDITLNRTRSQSKERPGSRTSQSSNISWKTQTEKDRKKSSSMVPELEVVEMPDALRQKFEDIEGDVEFLKDAHDSFKKIQYDGNDRADSPRPSSRPSRPSSTGFSHLDDFEKKLAAMESELANEEIQRQALDKIETEERSLSRGDNMWDLSSNIEIGSDFEQVALDFEEASEYQRETQFGSVRKTSKAKPNITDDGFYINQEEELHNVDHSMIKGGEFTTEPDDLGSGCVSPGQSDPRSKKVSFAASDERYEIERPGEVNTLGKKLFSFSPPKPMKKLPGKESHTEEAANISQELQSIEAPILVTKKSSSKEPSPILSDKNSSTKGLLKSLTGSPDPNRKESGSMFGSLLRKGRKSSRSGSRQSSVERSSQDLGSEEEGRTSSRASDVESDVGSENSLVMKLKKLTKRKPPKVQTADFDELFARGMAKSTQVESENNKDPFATRFREPVEKTVFTPFELYSKDKEFEKTQKQEGIGYAEKVLSFLDDQAHTPQITKDIIDDQETLSSKGNKEYECTSEEKNLSNNKKNINVVCEGGESEQVVTMGEIQLSSKLSNKDILTSKDLGKSPEEESPMLSQKSSSMKNLLSSITGGRIGSKSPDPNRGDSGSLFGSLLRKGRKGSRSGSRQSSVERGSQDVGSEDERRSASRTSDKGSDAGSENSISLRLKTFTKRKQPKVKTADFDELFARGMAKSAQFDSENNKNPFKTKNNNAASDAIKLPTIQTTKDLFTGRYLPKSPEEEFLAKITQFVAKYEVDSEYTEQVWPAVPSLDKMPPLRDVKSSSSIIAEVTQLTKSSRFTEKETETISREVRSKSKSTGRTTADPKDRHFNEQNDILKTNIKSSSKTSASYSEGNQEAVKITIVEQVPDEMEEKTMNTMSEADFLAKVTSFVAKYEPADEYAQKIWPAMSPKEEQEIVKESKAVAKKAPLLTKTPGKTYLDIESGTEWFGTSIEMENKDRDVIKEKTRKSKERTMKSGNNLTAGAALMRKHISATEPGKSTTPQKEDAHNDGNNEERSKSPTKIIIPPPDAKRTKSHSSEPTNIERDFPQPPVSPVVLLKKSSPRKDEPVDLLQLSNEAQTRRCSEQKDESVEQSSLYPMEPIRTPSPRKQDPIEVLQHSPVVAIRTEETMLRLQPEKQSANEDFYSKLVAGLRNITTPEPEHAKEVAEEDIYRKYSHHLGRAEFGTLRKRDSTQSSTSNLRYQSRDSVYNLPSRGLSRDPSFDKINVKLATSRKVSRQDSGDQMRSQSKVSDTSEALPDLELDDDLPPVLFSNREASKSVSRTHSGREGVYVHKQGGKKKKGKSKEDQSEIHEDIKPSAEVLTKKEEALRDVSDNKQKIKEVKEQIQNGLMTVVGLGVMAYLTTLETMGGGQ